MLKRVACLFLVVLMSINGFAAIVSDNDGQSFVTKKEFEDLKNNFNEQIDRYNNSLDNKIDGAIANYLSGIDVSKWISENIIMNKWDDVTCYNGAYAPTYSLPSVNIGFTYIHCWPSPYASGYRNGWWTLISNYKYTNDGSEYAYRPLVTGNKEDDQTDNMVWNGIAYKYLEQWDMNKSNMQTNGTWLTWMDGPVDHDYGGTLRNALKFNPNGSYDDAKAILANWTPNLYWVWKEKVDTDWDVVNVSISPANDQNYICVFNVTLATVNDKKTFHDHIIEYDGNTTWTVSNTEFTKTFRTSSSKTSTNLFTASTKSGIVAYWGLLALGGSRFTKSADGMTTTAIALDSSFDAGGGTQTPQVEDNSAETLPAVGMLAADQRSSDIYQFNDKRIVNFQNDEVTLEKQTLEKGFPLFYVKDDMEIEWKPVFNKYCKKSGDNWVEQNDDVKLYLSYGPFTNLTTSSDPVYFKSKNSTSESTSQVVKLTDDKIKFTSKKASIIYAKWVPDTTTYASDSWYSTLDLSKCNTFSYLD